jgi:hypothetical protein
VEHGEGVIISRACRPLTKVVESKKLARSVMALGSITTRSASAPTSRRVDLHVDDLLGVVVCQRPAQRRTETLR